MAKSSALQTLLQNIWERFDADTGSVTASNTSDIFTISGSGGIVTAISGDTLTISGASIVQATGSIDTHSDVDTTTTPPSAGEVLKWDGSNWVPSADSSAVNSVNGQTGVVTLDSDDISEGVSNFYYTGARFDTSFALKDTDSLSEGSSNFYYTEARVSANADVTANTAARHVSGSDNQDLWETITGNSGSAIASSQTDTLNIVGSGGIVTSFSGDTLTINGSGINSNKTHVTRTANYTANIEEFVSANGSSGGFTITLPTASGNTGSQITVAKVDSTANNITIDGNALETINGMTVFDLCRQWDVAVMESDGSNWVIT